MNLFQKFPKTFWVANAIELFERWAWYGFFMLFANYLTSSSDLGGLEFSQSQKGFIMGVGTGILYFLPVLTGAIADKYGYKRVLTFSFLIYISAFILIPMVSSFAAVFGMYLYLALGAALFKPVISATIAKTTTNETSSIGFGIFYMMVNIGAFFGPMVTLLFKDSYELVFYISAGIISLNFILLLFYKEPKTDNCVKKTGSLKVTLGEVFSNMSTVLKDWRFVIFLLIISGFWTMYNQLFYTLPVFISQWVDTSSMYDFFNTHIPFISENYSRGPGVMDPEFVTNLDALYIILLQIIVSSLIMKMKPLHSMISGFFVCSIGMALTLASQDIIFTMTAILIFALGEMAGSPKITEYIGRIAPDDKKALYMGFSFIPVFLGSIFAGFISGNVYQKMSDKVTFVKQYATENSLNIPEGLSSSAYFEKVAVEMNVSTQELTNILWVQYSPSDLWLVILSIGLGATLMLFLYNQFIIKDAK